MVEDDDKDGPRKQPHRALSARVEAATALSTEAEKRRGSDAQQLGKGEDEHEGYGAKMDNEGVSSGQ